LGLIGIAWAGRGGGEARDIDIVLYREGDAEQWLGFVALSVERVRLRTQAGVGHAADPDLVVARRGDAVQDFVDDLADRKAVGKVGRSEVVNAEIDGHRASIGILLATAPFFWREGNVADDKPDIERWVDEGAKAIGLPIAP